MKRVRESINYMEKEGIGTINTNEVHEMCPLCSHTAPILTNTHMIIEHGLDYEHARILTENPTLIKPYTNGAIEYHQKFRKSK